jgi:tellurite methyltransferase
MQGRRYTRSVGKNIVDYFEQRHRRQDASADVPLNAFQETALRFASGRVLDLACGLGGFSIAAARNGCEVVAVDASATAIDRLAAVARAERLDISAERHDVATYQPDGSFDAVVAIGILMFFPREVGFGILERLQRAVVPGGHAIVTVLMEGTTFTDVFGGEPHHLFTSEELETAFAGWTMLSFDRGEYPALQGTVKRIGTIVARKPPAGAPAYDAR